MAATNELESGGRFAGNCLLYPANKLGNSWTAQENSPEYVSAMLHCQCIANLHILLYFAFLDIVVEVHGLKVWAIIHFSIG